MRFGGILYSKYLAREKRNNWSLRVVWKLLLIIFGTPLGQNGDFGQVGDRKLQVLQRISGYWTA